MVVVWSARIVDRTVRGPQEEPEPVVVWIERVERCVCCITSGECGLQWGWRPWREQASREDRLSSGGTAGASRGTIGC